MSFSFRSWPLLVGFACVALACTAAPATAGMSAAERTRLDFSAYKVTAPSAGYFDVRARKAVLTRTRNPILLKEIARLRQPLPCREPMSIPVFAGDTPTPDYYDDPEGWKRHSVKFHAFEDAVSTLAGAQMVSATPDNGRCLLQLLDRWATGRAFLSYERRQSGLQTWFQIESALFASAFAYAVVRDEVKGMPEEKQRIEQWLVAAARKHLSYEGGEEGTCCNNHFYRRAVYAAMIGVLASQDDLFRFGISAIYSAIADSTPDGALRLEMGRSKYAAHYQNYATMYLVFIAQIAKRQGYNLYSISDDGRSLDTIISYSLASSRDPRIVARHAGTEDQKTFFLKDDQFFGWLELVAQRPAHRKAALQVLNNRRPTYNRSLGGCVTLYFLQPDTAPPP